MSETEVKFIILNKDYKETYLLTQKELDEKRNSLNLGIDHFIWGVRHCEINS